MITGTLSPEDYLHAQRLHRKSATSWWIAIAAALLAGGIAMVLIAKRDLGVILFCAGAGTFVGEFFTSYIYLPHRVKKLHRQQKDLGSPFTYSWDSSHLEAKGVNGSARRPWTNYVKMKENEHCFLLYHSDNLFEMFPKAWFPAPTEVAEFRKLASLAAET